MCWEEEYVALVIGFIATLISGDGSSSFRRAHSHTVKAKFFFGVCHFSLFFTFASSLWYWAIKGKVIFSQVFVCPQSASWLLDHCSSLLQRGRYASYWNAFLFGKGFTKNIASCHVKNHWRIFLGGGGAWTDARPGPIFFVFMQFLWILSQIISWRPVLGNTRSATDIKRCQASKTELQDRVGEKVFFRLIDYYYINFRSKLTSKLKTYIFIAGKTKLLETKHQRRKTSQTLKRDKTETLTWKEAGRYRRWGRCSRRTETLGRGAANTQTLGRRDTRKWGTDSEKSQERWKQITDAV